MPGVDEAGLEEGHWFLESGAGEEGGDFGGGEDGDHGLVGGAEVGDLLGGLVG